MCEYVLLIVHYRLIATSMYACLPELLYVTLWHVCECLDACICAHMDI